MSLYERFIWRWTTRRPLTYVMRSLLKDYPLAAWPFVAAVVSGSFLLAAWTLITFGWVALPALAFFGFVMSVLAHTTWDTAGAHIKTVSDFVRRRR